jgi:cytochrome b561
LHKSFGLTVIGLTLLRIVWRLMHPVPPLPGHMTRIEVALAKSSHTVFYILMLAMPMTGWAMVSTSMKRFPINYFGLGQAPYLPLEQAKPLAHYFGSAHELLGYTAIALIAVHVLAAFKHHVFDRDDVLMRMLPWGKAARG